ncbi:hypothetical protein, partial [Shewanella sp. AC91-MNA-CIBAN-0169]|uniref:hypothetical protein n=1 Tax=Shewanella sp. AC91-MNA-CIBAN-0169 TaxID=3140466 RepID=UPI003318B142
PTRILVGIIFHLQDRSSALKRSALAHSLGVIRGRMHSMSFGKILFATLLFAILGGCDTIYGITRYSSIGSVQLPI